MLLLQLVWGSLITVPLALSVIVTIVIHHLWRFLVNFPLENPGVSETPPLPSQCFYTTVLHYYDRSIFSMARSLGQPPPYA